MAEIPEFDLPFRWEWRGPDLGPARPASLYGSYPLESLPPLPELDQLDGTLSWLPIFDWVNEAPEELESLAEGDATLRDNQEQIAREAATLGLTLPPAYKRLMSSSAIVESFPEYAGSWFPYEERFSTCIFGGRGRLLCFLRDQQNSVVWDLYLTPDGGEFVVSSWEARIETALWDKFNDGVLPNDEERAKTLVDATVCATSFEGFLYRLWLEIRISDKRGSSQDALLTDVERRYLAHYKTGQHLRVTQDDND